MYEAFEKAAAPIFCTVDGMRISYISDWPAQDAKPFEVPTVLNAPGPIVLNPLTVYDRIYHRINYIAFLHIDFPFFFCYF